MEGWPEEALVDIVVIDEEDEEGPIEPIFYENWMLVGINIRVIRIEYFFAIITGDVKITACYCRICSLILHLLISISN